MNRRSITSDDGDDITHGTLVVLAYLHEQDGTVKEITRSTKLARSTVWQWVTALNDAGIIDSEVERQGRGPPTARYRLNDDELGAAARQLVDRVLREPFDEDSTRDSNRESNHDEDVSSPSDTDH